MHRTKFNWISLLLSLSLPSMVTVHLPSFRLPARRMPKKRRSCEATEAAASNRKWRKVVWAKRKTLKIFCGSCAWPRCEPLRRYGYTCRIRNNKLRGEAQWHVQWDGIISTKWQPNKQGKKGKVSTRMPLSVPVSITPALSLSLSFCLSVCPAVWRVEFVYGTNFNAINLQRTHRSRRDRKQRAGNKRNR